MVNGLTMYQRSSYGQQVKFERVLLLLESVSFKKRQTYTSVHRMKLDQRFSKLCQSLPNRKRDNETFQCGAPRTTCIWATTTKYKNQILFCDCDHAGINGVGQLVSMFLWLCLEVVDQFADIGLRQNVSILKPSKLNMAKWKKIVFFRGNYTCPYSLITLSLELYRSWYLSLPQFPVELLSNDIKAQWVLRPFNKEFAHLTAFRRFWGSSRWKLEGFGTPY